MNQEYIQAPVKTESNAKKFWRVVFGTVVGFFISCIIISILSLIMMVSMLSSLSDQPVINDNSILKLTLNRPIQERVADNPFEELGALDDYYNTAIGLNDILKCIETAAVDPQIKGIYLNLSSISASPATLKEIRDALVQFKTSGKFVMSYSEIYSQSAYYLSSVADQVYLNKKGVIDFRGVAFQIMFYKGLLEKLDLDMQVVRHGQFKSAVEPYLLDKMSEANRTQMTLLSNTIWNTMLQDINKSRNISIDSLNLIADHLLCQSAEEAVSLKLVDQLCYKNEFENVLKSSLSLADDQDIHCVTLSEYKKIVRNQIKTSSDKIAVVYATGEIVDGKGEDDNIGSETFCKELRKAYQNKNVKAIVLRVNSPGGSALASEVIWNEIELAKKSGKIVVTSMGDYAASGGYYISCNSDAIVAQPNTLTGSIGVFGMIPNLQNTLKNKLGITIDVVKTNEHSDYGSGFRKLDEVELQKLQVMVEEVYGTFTQRVADGRGLTVEQVDEIGQGRVWAGADALNIKLVDQLGTINDAIALAAQMAKISDYSIIYYPKQTDWLTQLMQKDDDTAIKAALKAELGDLYYTYEGLKHIMNAEGIQARLPMEMVIE